MAGDWFDDNMKKAALADAQKVCEQAARIAALKEALLPFVKLANQFSEHAHDDNWTIFARNGATVYLADLRRARSTYEGKT